MTGSSLSTGPGKYRQARLLSDQGNLINKTVRKDQLNYLAHRKEGNITTFIRFEVSQFENSMFAIICMTYWS